MREIAWAGYLSDAGRSVASWSAGVRGSRVRVCWRQVQGFVSNCWQVAVKLDRTARRRPPSSLPKKSQFLRLCQAWHNRNYAEFGAMRS